MNSNLLINRLAKISRSSFARNGTPKTYSSKSKDGDAEIPVNTIKDFYTASEQNENGKIYDKKPFKILCEEGKVYHWCLCGHSKRQPFCDGTHNNIYLKITQKPIKFSVSKTKEYWLCNCKQTTNRPFCDGTHKREDIQDKRMYTN